MRLPPAITTTVCRVLIALGSGLARPASAAEVRVLNANSLTIALRELAADQTKQIGTQMPTGLQVVKLFRIVVEDSIFGLIANVGPMF